jgi:hypothetical protein
MFIGTPLYRPVQELDPVHREGDGREILFHLALQEVGSPIVQHVAEPAINFWKQDVLIDAGEGVNTRMESLMKLVLTKPSTSGGGPG